MYDKPDLIHEIDNQSDEESKSSDSLTSDKSDNDEEIEDKFIEKQVEFVKLNKESLVKATQSLITDGFWIN
jgi:hypothetical protein